ncbi:MAG TPA: choice-of-anchor B family protein [Pilimelia sp.]|nr:choice-of-anchor B family protein [Pilimelia sp.]
MNCSVAGSSGGRPQNVGRFASVRYSLTMRGWAGRATRIIRARPTTATDHNQFVKGNFSYLSNYRAGLRIVDLTNVADPPTMTEAALFDVDPASNAAGFAGTWTNYPYYPSGNVAVFSIQRGLFVLHSNSAAAHHPGVLRRLRNRPRLDH